VRYPIAGIAGCCARATIGHAAALPSPAMNVRRRIHPLLKLLCGAAYRGRYGHGSQSPWTRGPRCRASRVGYPAARKPLSRPRPARRSPPLASDWAVECLQPAEPESRNPADRARDGMQATEMHRQALALGLVSESRCSSYIAQDRGPFGPAPSVPSFGPHGPRSAPMRPQ
jgi:hypothetical protein